VEAPAVAETDVEAEVEAHAAWAATLATVRLVRFVVSPFGRAWAILLSAD